MFLNVRRPPFDDVRVRRAFAYAVDRQHMADLHGKQLAEPTCQFVPPNVPGYARYCPYTIDPSAAENWTPNLPRARELIRRSGTAGQRVVVWTFRSYHAEGKYVVSLLRELGYNARLNYVADTGEYFGQLIARPDAQAGLLGWFGGTLAADMFSNFSCEAASWQSRFCDPRVDRDVEALLKEQLADPKAAAAHAAQLDRELVDRAFWVPVLTPRWADLTSARVGNFQANGSDGPLVDQMWVR